MNKLECFKSSSIRGVIESFNQQIANKQNEIFEYALRNYAEPPIKGEITKGKIKWRGISIIHDNSNVSYKTWLEQRGKRISQMIEIYSKI